MIKKLRNGDIGKRLVTYMIIIILIIMGMGVIYMINVYNTDWNDYWFERFEDGQCDKVCEEREMVSAMQSPSYCGCRLEILCKYWMASSHTSFSNNRIYYYNLCYNFYNKK